MSFILHPKLAADTSPIGETDLCVVLLMNDKRCPWFVLVPKVEFAREIYDLDEAQRAQLIEDSARFSKAVMAVFRGNKMNVAALGNVVPQLHVHHIVRTEDDVAWPGVTWRVGDAEPYAPEEIARVRERVRKALGFLR